MLDKPLLPTDPVKTSDNTYMKPVFEEGSWSQAESSPGIGRGVDSVMVGERLYVAPSLDLEGNTRPNGSDDWVDLGALESNWPLKMLPEATLATIYLTPYALEPDFQTEVLDYEISVPDTLTSLGTLNAVPVDCLAEVLVEGPSNLISQMEADRTTTITVHSSDRSTQRNYSVLFQLRSIDASLSMLEVSLGELEPSFDPEHLSYVDTLPYGTTETPEVSYTTANENASVTVTPAKDVTSKRWLQKTTKVIVTAEMGKPSKYYTVEFVVADSAVSFRDTDFTPAVHLYPNPFSSYATLEIQNPEMLEGIQLINMLGQVVRHIDYSEGESTIIERKGLPSGLYFLRIQSNTTRILKVLLE